MMAVDRKAARLVWLLTLSLAAAGQGPVHARAPEHGKKEIYLDPKEGDATWHLGWADAVITGDLIFVSGIIASLSGEETGADTRPAFERAFDRLSAVLSKSGADLDDIVELTAYLTNVERDTSVLNRVRVHRMRRPYAASTVVEVSRLIPPRGVAELRVVARRKAH